MATDMGKLQKRKSIINPIIWKSDASRGNSQRFTIVSWKILNFVHPSSNMIEMKKFVSKWTILRTRISHYMTESEYFRNKQNWWISLNYSGNTGPLRNRSDFNEALSTLNRWHQESGERQLRHMPFWKYQQRHLSSSSSSSWWQWSGSWWSS